MATAVMPVERLVTAALPSQVPVEAPRAVHDELAALGRTEDVRLAPNGKRLAIVGFTRATIAVAAVEISRSMDGPRVVLSGIDTISTPAFHHPHGVDWLDDETLVVANRDAGVTVVRLGHSPQAQDSRSALFDGPGSLAVRRFEESRKGLLVCNNWADTITRHEVKRDGRLGAGATLLARWLDLPDGVALSRDGRWLAVSNHNTHCVVVFDYERLDASPDPVAVLRGLRYPHGLRFDAEGRHLVVADAGAPHVHVFATEGDWRGVSHPAATVAVMDDDLFARGHRRREEGGPKGIELDPATNVLLVTSEQAPLACFDLVLVLERPDAFRLPVDGLLDAELEALSSAASAKAAAARDRAELRAIMATKAWRLTALPRRAYGVVRAVARRRSTVPSSSSSDTSSGASASARSESSA